MTLSRMTLFILYRYPRDNTRQIQKTKSQHNKTGKRWKLANRRVDTKGIGIFWHIVTMYASFSLIYDSLVRKYKNVTIRLQKEQENPLKIYFFQTMEKMVIYVSIHGHCDCTSLQHYWASGYAEVIQGGTTSMPTGTHIDIWYCTVVCNFRLLFWWNQ